MCCTQLFPAQLRCEAFLYELRSTGKLQFRKAKMRNLWHLHHLSCDKEQIKTNILWHYKHRMVRFGYNSILYCGNQTKNWNQLKTASCRRLNGLINMSYCKNILFCVSSINCQRKVVLCFWQCWICSLVWLDSWIMSVIPSELEKNTWMHVLILNLVNLYLHFTWIVKETNLHYMYTTCKNTIYMLFFFLRRSLVRFRNNDFHIMVSRIL